MRGRRQLLLALVALCLLAAVCVGCKPAEESPPADNSSSAEPTASPEQAPVHPRPVIGMQNGNLVLFDPDAGVTSGLIDGVNATGVLAIHPAGDWIVIQSPRRWDGLDIAEATAVNVQTGTVWRLSEQAGQQVHIRPLGWSECGMYYEPDSAFSGDAPVTYAWDFTTGAVTTAVASPKMQPWADFGEQWGVPLSVPDPSPDDGIDFWAIGQADVSTEGKEAVVWLRPGWAEPSLDELYPVYLLEADGSPVRLPLERPVVFAETLGLHH